MWGGGWQAAQKEVVGKSFEEATGAKVEYVSGNPRDHIAKMLAAKGQEPPFDVVQLDDATEELAASQGLLAKMSEKDIPELKELFKEAFMNGEYGPGFVFTQIGIAYNAERFQQNGVPAPRRVSDLWNPKLKSKVAVPGLGTVMGPIALTATAIEFGGSQADIAPGLAKLKELNPIVYTDSAQVETMFTNNEIWAALWIDGRTYSLAAKNYPIKFVRPIVGNKGLVGLSSFDTVSIVQGTKKTALADLWVRRQLSAEAGVAFAKRGNYGPTNTKAAAELAKDPKYKEQFISDPKDLSKTLRLDNHELNQEIAAWFEKWGKALAK